MLSLHLENFGNRSTASDAEKRNSRVLTRSGTPFVHARGVGAEFAMHYCHVEFTSCVATLYTTSEYSKIAKVQIWEQAVSAPAVKW